MPVHRCAPDNLEAFLRKLDADGERVISCFKDDAEVIVITGPADIVKRGAA